MTVPISLAVPERKRDCLSMAIQYVRVLAIENVRVFGLARFGRYAPFTGAPAMCANFSGQKCAIFDGQKCANFSGH